MKHEKQIMETTDKRFPGEALSGHNLLLTFTDSIIMRARSGLRHNDRHIRTSAKLACSCLSENPALREAKNLLQTTGNAIASPGFIGTRHTLS